MTATTIATGSKPDQIDALRKVWRQSGEHKAAQIKRFFSALGAVLFAQVAGDIGAGKDPLSHFTDARTAWYYLVPFAYIAWRQLHPSMTASQADSAQGVTIVPEQVGVVPEPAPEPEAQPEPEVVADPVEPEPDLGLDTLPTGDFSADGTPAPPDYPAPEGDAAP